LQDYLLFHQLYRANSGFLGYKKYKPNNIENMNKELELHDSKLAEVKQDIYSVTLLAEKGI